MIIKWFGAILIIASCGGFGCSLAVGIKMQEKMLTQMIHILGILEAELKYKLTALPELCRIAARESDGILRDIFQSLYTEFSQNIHPDASGCMDTVLQGIDSIPCRIKKHLRRLGRSLGRFDLQGQVQGLQAVRNACEADLGHVQQNRDMRLRSYQTLSLCAGTALVILFL